MARFSNKTLSAVKDLLDGVDGLIGTELKPSDSHEPKGKAQECDTGHVKTEWVDQRCGIAGDDWTGTVTWKIGGFYLIAHFAS